MDVAEYKHIVLGLIFLKYISDAFNAQLTKLMKRFANPDDEFYLEEVSEREAELEDRDYYTADNVFWLPEAARWDNI